MSYILHVYNDAPILLLECPAALDFYSGLAEAEDYINQMALSSERVYLVIDLPDSEIYADVFIDFLKTRTLQNEPMIYSRHVKVIVVGNAPLRHTINNYFANNSMPPVHISTFDETKEAIELCYRDYHGILSVRGA